MPGRPPAFHGGVWCWQTASSPVSSGLNKQSALTWGHQETGLRGLGSGHGTHGLFAAGSWMTLSLWLFPIELGVAQSVFLLIIALNPLGGQQHWDAGTVPLRSKPVFSCLLVHKHGRLEWAPCGVGEACSFSEITGGEERWVDTLAVIYL